MMMDQRAPQTPLQPPLAGIKVIEIGMAMAGPFCGMMLADYGADVIKVERIGEGDESRRWAPFFPGQVSHYFVAANRNKRSLEIDLKNKHGLEILRRLIVDADVVIDNFRVGALEALGLGYEELRKINPRLIYCSISGFGPNGPRAQDRANDIFMQAFAGSMSVTGEEGRGPVKSGISVADIGGALFGTIGLMMALEARHRTGVGQRVDTSLLEGQIAMLSYHLPYYFASGKVPVRRGASMQLSVAYRAFEASDDWVVVAAFTNRMWQDVCHVIGREDWLTDERYRTPADRAARRDELIPMLNAIFKTKTVAEWVELLSQRGVPCTAVNAIDQVVREPQVVARDMVVSIEHPLAGTIRMAGLPIKMSETPGAVRTAAPLLGQHSEEILREVGYTPLEIEEFLAGAVVGTARAGAA
jgi:crotonobetainyl-CoA:carnitine CoA-transferase CaiB-like acyl-CoA transferase